MGGSKLKVEHGVWVIRGGVGGNVRDKPRERVGIMVRLPFWIYIKGKTNSPLKFIFAAQIHYLSALAWCNCILSLSASLS